jgi:hypothetical protein
MHSGQFRIIRDLSVAYELHLRIRNHIVLGMAKKKGRYEYLPLISLS